MIRLIGILTGSTVAVAFLIVVLGVPELAAPEAANPDVTAPPNQLAYEPKDEPKSEVPLPVEPALQPEPDTVLASVPEPSPAQDTFEDAVFEEQQQVPLTEEATMQETLAQETLAQETLAQEALAQETLAQETLDQQWYAFWSPFRSEIAADGFVSQLQRSTGLDYRVVKLKPGVYEVAFAYSDDSDIENKLTQISAATGLDLSGG